MNHALAFVLALSASLQLQAEPGRDFQDICHGVLTAVADPFAISSIRIPPQPIQISLPKSGPTQSVLYFKTTPEHYEALVEKRSVLMGTTYKGEVQYDPETGLGILVSSNGSGHAAMAKVVLNFHQTKVSQIDGNPMEILGGYRWSSNEDGVPPGEIYASDNYPISPSLFPILQQHFEVTWQD